MKNVTEELAKIADVDPKSVEKVLYALGYKSVEEKLHKEGGKELSAKIQASDLKLAARYARSGLVV